MSLKTVYRLHGPENMVFSYVYIGSTELPLKTRLHQHLNDAINHRHDTDLCEAIRKYRGWRMISIERIDASKAASRENYWMDFFRKEGYIVLNMRKSNQSYICGFH